MLNITYLYALSTPYTPFFDRNTLFVSETLRHTGRASWHRARLHRGNPIGVTKMDKPNNSRNYALFCPTLESGSGSHSIVSACITVIHKRLILVGNPRNDGGFLPESAFLKRLTSLSRWGEPCGVTHQLWGNSNVKHARNQAGILYRLSDP